jgi:hypothetical protein
MQAAGLGAGCHQAQSCFDQSEADLAPQRCRAVVMAGVPETGDRGTARALGGRVPEVADVAVGQFTGQHWIHGLSPSATAVAGTM